MHPVDNVGLVAHVYEDRILAFFDILGFSNLVEDSIKDESKATDILKLLTSLEKAIPHYEIRCNVYYIVL